jgi:hypothetical protein
VASWLDRLVLLRSRIISEHPVADRCRLFVTDHDEGPLVLKFAYPGNIQYHRLSHEEARRLSDLLAEVSEPDAEFT